jgi:hypothetical protein
MLGSNLDPFDNLFRRVKYPDDVVSVGKPVSYLPAPVIPLAAGYLYILRRQIFAAFGINPKFESSKRVFAF